MHVINLQDRVDKLTLFYMDKHYDISKMSIEEYLTTYIEIGKKIYDTMQNLSK